MLIPREYAFATTVEECKALDLPWRPGGYGLLFCEQDSDRSHVTVMTEDVEYVRLLKITSDSGDASLGGLTIPDGKFPMARSGWPDEWATIAPGEARGL